MSENTATNTTGRNQKKWTSSNTIKNPTDIQKHGPYVPPAKRHGKKNGGRGDVREDTVDAAKSGFAPSNRKGGNSRPQQTKSKSNQKGSQKRKNNGGQQQRLRVYSSSGNSESDRGFWKMVQDCTALRYKVHKPRCDCPKLLKTVQHHDNAGDELSAVMLQEDGKVDALVVVPDTKQKFIYVCKDTSLEVFESDPFGAEKRLRNELFPEDTTSESRPTEANGFKLSCASCLLRDHEPNGFCLVASSSESVVDAVCYKSRSNQRKKEASGLALHQDHAHFVARLPSSALWNLYRSKTRGQKGQAVDAILDHLSSQDIEPTNLEEFTGTITLGHHLSSVLTQKGRSKEVEYWFVMGYDDRKSLELDLPGGKRHLGETSLEGAMRETEEETSLIWDASWVKGFLQSKKPSEVLNRYFVLHPPEQF